MSKSRFLQRLQYVLAGHPEPASAACGDPDLRARVAALELDVRDRDERIEAMKRDYSALEIARDRAAAGAGEERLEKVLRKACGPLANLVTLAEAARAGKEVTAAEKQLAAAGLERIGRPDEETPFDVATHQRMSGGTVHAGTPVRLRMPGYKLGQKVLIKAMVTARED